MRLFRSRHTDCQSQLAPKDSELSDARWVIQNQREQIALLEQRVALYEVFVEEQGADLKRAYELASALNLMGSGPPSLSSVRTAFGGD